MAEGQVEPGRDEDDAPRLGKPRRGQRVREAQGEAAAGRVTQDRDRGGVEPGEQVAVDRGEGATGLAIGVLGSQAVAGHLDAHPGVGQPRDQRPVLRADLADVRAAVQVHGGSLRRPAARRHRVAAETGHFTAAHVVPPAQRRRGFGAPLGGRDLLPGRARRSPSAGRGQPDEQRDGAHPEAGHAADPSCGARGRPSGRRSASSCVAAQLASSRSASSDGEPGSAV